MTMARVTQLGYVGIGASDVAAWEPFAQEILGLEVSEKLPDGTLLLRMDDYHYRIAIHPSGTDDLLYQGWQVEDERALHQIAEQVRAFGIEVAQGTPEEAAARRVKGLIRFPDPDGFQNEVFYGPLVNLTKPFRSPRNISGFVTGDQGLGHTNIFVKDVEQCVRFYRDALGMKMSDYIRSMAFLHCNPRHHSLAIGPGPRPKRAWHIMLQVQSIDDVGSTYYLCQEKGVPISVSLGRHTNDLMISFYLTTPSGIDIEYGCGGRTVGPDWQMIYYDSGGLWGHKRMEQAAGVAPQPAAQRA
jgi:2,3-dihydroxybiphenyl 1,2-dioxygenase